MTENQTRALHLHTLPSLLSDLASGRSVAIDGREDFALSSSAAQSILNWYRGIAPKKWSGGVSVADGDSIVNAALQTPPEVAQLPAKEAHQSSRQLTLKRVEAHRFAGIHRYGSVVAPPANFVFDFSSGMTLFEGRNGSGKTSLLNAVIWALTGEVLRPQTAPVSTTDDLQCWIERDDEAPPSEHRLSPITPMPDADTFSRSDAAIPADSWVELTFEDEKGTKLPPIRRTHSRTSRGKIIEEFDPSPLNLDPIAFRIGTIMPALLGTIQVGSESELGKAVSELTGLSALVDLADHARRARDKIQKDFSKARQADITSLDRQYNVAKLDLENELVDRPQLRPELAVPPPSDDTQIEQQIKAIISHFENHRSEAYQSARDLLGNAFDPSSSENSKDLEENIGPALTELSQLGRLTSISRLSGLKAISPEELAGAKAEIEKIVAQLRELQELERQPDVASRVRLYSRVAEWIKSDDPEFHISSCAVCGGTLAEAKDKVTGRSVKSHLYDAAENAKLLSQTVSQWSLAALNALTTALPDALQRELKGTLPDHPFDLIRTALVDELFSTAPFKGVLTELKAQVGKAFDCVSIERPEVEKAPLYSDIPVECHTLFAAIARVEKAIGFSSWRNDNDVLVLNVATKVIGRLGPNGEEVEAGTLRHSLQKLDDLVKAAKPLSGALKQCNRLETHLADRRKVEKRLTEYGDAVAGLEELISLDALSNIQVEGLRQILRDETKKWRNQIYVGAFPTTAHELVDTPVGKEGELDLHVRSGRVTAPAQNVSNASALRASLIAFYLAFWDYVFKERGGLRPTLPPGFIRV